jgi:hypothetical protein
VLHLTNEPAIVMFEQVYALYSLHKKILPFFAALVAT